MKGVDGVPDGNRMKDVTVEASHLSVQFDHFFAVKDVSFSVKKGEIFGFLGANGAGKTTTIRVLCGLIHPNAGTVRVAGIPFTGETDTGDINEREIKRRVGYMSQKFTLYNDLTISENLSFIASLRGLDSKLYKKRRAWILKFIAFDRSLSSYISDLPPGIKQQVSLAASILHDPEIVFLDEPTAGVTPVVRARFWALIRELSAIGKTVFVTTHYMDEAEQCDRIALMRSGKIVAQDSPSNLKKITFTDKIYELEPKERITFSQIESLKFHPGFTYFVPYGLRFHAVFANSKQGLHLKEELSKKFAVQEITPSLEDVFIKTIESDVQEDDREKVGEDIVL